MNEEKTTHKLVCGSAEQVEEKMNQLSKEGYFVFSGHLTSELITGPGVSSTVWYSVLMVKYEES